MGQEERQACRYVGHGDRGIESWNPQLGLTISLSADAEHDLVQCIDGHGEEGAPVSPTMLRLRALRVKTESGAPYGFFEPTNL